MTQAVQGPVEREYKGPQIPGGGRVDVLGTRRSAQAARAFHAAPSATTCSRSVTLGCSHTFCHEAWGQDDGRVQGTDAVPCYNEDRKARREIVEGIKGSTGSSRCCARRVRCGRRPRRRSGSRRRPRSSAAPATSATRASAMPSRAPTVRSAPRRSQAGSSSDGSSSKRRRSSSAASCPRRRTHRLLPLAPPAGRRREPQQQQQQQRQQQRRRQ